MSTENQKTTILSSSTYDIQEQFLKIAANYMEVSDSNTLKAGLLGYMTEAMSHVAQHGVHHRNLLYNEFFLNTARLPKSIYNESKILDVNPVIAKPASMSVVLLLKKNDIIRFGTKLPNGTIEFTIDRLSSFFVKDIPFLLPSTVKVLANKSESDTNYAVSAVYDLEDTNSFEFSDIKTPYIKTWSQTVEGEKYFSLVVKIYQCNISTSKFTVYSNDIASTLTYDINYENQLSAFNVYYSFPIGSEPEKLNLYFNNSYNPDNVDEKYTYYSYPSDQSMDISFSGLPNAFRPQLNSELSVETFTTLGSKGNFEFKNTAEILFSFKDVSMANIPVSVRSLSNSAGGSDKQSLIDLKNTLIKENLSRNVLITDYDLDNFFNSIIERDTIYNSKIEFFKKRDDIITRLFSAFLLMRNSNGSVIPTNTINIAVQMSELERLDYKLTPGTIIIFDRELKQYRLLRSDEYPESYIDNNNIIMYSLPYLINILSNPFPKVSYYKNSIEKEISLVYKDLNYFINYEFIINGINIKRNSILNDSFEISASLATNLPQDKLDNDGVIIKGILKKDNKAYGYFDMPLVSIVPTTPIQYEYRAVLNTNDKINSKSQFPIINSIKDINTDEYIPNCYIDEDMDIEIGVFYNGSEDKTKYGLFNLIKNKENYCNVSTFKSEESISLFKTMDDVMTSDLIIQQNGLFIIKDIPVISSHFFTNVSNYSELYKILGMYETVLKDNFDRLENNTSIDMKFFNTYGISNLSTVDTTNISMEFNIKLNNINVTNELDISIKEFIKTFVEKSNSELFTVSNLITALETTFSEIRYVEFRNINNLNIQKIEKLFTDKSQMTKEQIINYIPEYINIGMIKKKFGSEDNFESSIKLNYL